MKNKKIQILVAIALVVGVIVILCLTGKTCVSPSKTESPDTLVVRKPVPQVLLYDLPKDSFTIETAKVRNNQFLSDILISKGITYQQIDQLITVSRPYFDFRKMKVGNSYSLFISKDSLRRLDHFVYEIDNTGFVTVSFADTITVRLGQKLVTSIGKSSSGVIKSSLWNTIKDNQLSPMLAIELSEIFAWTVDFFGIEKGDYFKVIYDEDYVEGTSIGISKIHAAVFQHHKKMFYAFNFEEDSIWDFFDENGQSLRKAFLKAPLRFSRISSRYSHGRLHPILKIVRPHHGIDYAAPSGTPVYSIGDGRVIAKGWDSKGGGNYIKIKHNSVYTTVYMHLSGFAKGIGMEQHVKQGDLIGYVGSTGHSTGPHLDFRVFRNGSPMDPLKVESPPVEPVKPENMDRFKKFIEPLQKSLEQIQVD